MKGEIKCMKYLLFIFNFLLWCLGVAGVGIGIWIRHDQGVTSLIDSKLIEPASWAIIILSLFVLILGFFGYCGAVRENTCMLITYSILMSLLILLYIVAMSVMFAAVQDKEFKDKIKKRLTEVINKRQKDQVFVKSMDIIQEKGCAERLFREIKKEIGMVGGIAAAIAAVLVITLIFSICVTCSLRQRERVKNYIN